MGHGISAAAQIRSLAKAVSAAFAASNLTEEEKSPGRIEITDMSWQAPPLLTDAAIDGVPLQGFLDVPLALTQEDCRRFWTDGLNMMWHNPSRLMRRGVIAAGGPALSKLKLGQRNLRFPQPAGWPGEMDQTAGALFSMEVAHAAAISLPVSRYVQEEDDYFVEFGDGSRIGVANGRVIGDTPWDASVRGMVPDLASMLRGQADCIPRFDQLASLRSVLHVHQKRFPTNFEGLDLALQALRLLSLGSYCPDLIKEMYIAPLDMMTVRAQEIALRESIQVIAERDMSDRSKLRVMFSQLVPGTLTLTSFRQNIFHSEQYPFTLAAGRMDDIEAWLRKQYEIRIPADARQLKE